MIYTLEKKTQRERLNERLRSSLDSTQFRIRNAPFFHKFSICSIAGLNNFLLSTTDKKIFLKNFIFSTAGFKPFNNFFWLITKYLLKNLKTVESKKVAEKSENQRLKVKKLLKNLKTVVSKKLLKNL